MFFVAKSQLPGATDGLYAKKKIERGTLVRLNTLKPETSTTLKEFDYLDFYVSESCDDASPCVIDGSLSTIKHARKICELNSRPLFVRAADMLMKANDRGWRSDGRNTPEKYRSRIRENAFEFVLAIDKTVGVHGVYAYFTRDVKPDEEIGSTYGWAYWA